MAKVSSPAAKDQFRWRLFVQAIQSLPFDDMIHQVIHDASWRRRSRVRRWIFLLVGATGLFYWNGRLVLALGAGTSVMLLVYLLHDWPLDWNLAHLRRYLQGWNQPFVLSVGAGAIATFTTYTAAAVWAESESTWIATAIIVQGMGTLASLLWLLGEAVNRQASRDRLQHHQLLQDLTHDDPLKRLLAVRQLTDRMSVLADSSTAQRGSAKPLARRELADCFRLMLNREDNPIVRDAIWDGLQTLEIVHQLKQATEPIVTISARPQVQQRQQRVSLPTHH